MIKISKQADYGILLLGQFAKEHLGTTHSARDLSTSTHVGLPMVSKILKLLVRAGILESQRGAHGGYSLNRSPEGITVGEIIVALDGPIAVTDCAPTEQNRCDLEPYCSVSGSWNRLNDAIRVALDRVTLAEMTCPVADPVGSFAGHGTD